MTKAPAALATTLLIALLAAGCGSDDTDRPTATPSSAPAATSAAPSPTVDKDRRGCQAISSLPKGADVHPEAIRDAGALAAEATTPGIAQAGVALVAAAAKLTAEPGVESNLAADRAILAVSGACIAKFGDGPW
ncbi:hypothetical protein [Micromonospora sp. NBRC 101691]|uniref:hypothetical protein n=1 Tax=Micromonospora sp. NBRC 101691 TaxID=3032198 RepID=UPI0024A5730C|nr:hypothetical protein [Micromonospora sp. NBRC 101691]GLY21703.1 hypothetical protein Misp04_14350 [Micromonospora sp. NBRC 101691]